MKRIPLVLAGICSLSALWFFPATVPAAESKPIKIGALFSVTGPASFLGAPEEKTARMLVDEINASGGVKGQKVELVLKDTAGSPERAVSFAKQLIEEDKVLAIIGPSTSGETMKIKDLCEENKMLLVSCAAAETSFPCYRKDERRTTAASKPVLTRRSGAGRQTQPDACGAQRASDRAAGRRPQARRHARRPGAANARRYALLFPAPL